MTLLLLTIVPPRESLLGEPPDWLFYVLVAVLVLLNVVLYFLAEAKHRHADNVYREGFAAYKAAADDHRAAAKHYDDSVALIEAWEVGPACAWCGRSRAWSKAHFLSEIGGSEIRVLVEHLPDNSVRASVIECKWAADLIGKSADGSDTYKAHDALRALLVAAVAT